MRLDAFLAWRFLREGRMQSVLIVIGAAVGVTVVVFLSALIAAVGRTIVSQTLDVLPHIVVRMPDEAVRELPGEPGKLVIAAVEKPAQRVRSVEQWQAVLRDLDATPGIVAASPTATGPGIASRGAANRSVTLLGVDPDRFARVIGVLPRMRSGALQLGGTDAVIGVELAKDLGVRVGDRILIATATNTPRAFQVAGLFDLGNRDVNRRWVLVSLRNGQTLLGIAGGVSNIDLRIADIWTANDTADRIAARTGLNAESWMKSNEQLMVAIRSQESSSLTIEVFIVLAVAMGIASVLIVSVVQKSRQIGILRAMGISRGTILRLFLVQGAAIGLVGAAVGSLAGAGLAVLFERSATNPDGTPTYQVKLPPSLFLIALALATVTGVLAAVAPARRAARLDPAEAIRHE